MITIGRLDNVEDTAEYTSWTYLIDYSKKVWRLSDLVYVLLQLKLLNFGLDWSWRSADEDAEEYQFKFIRYKSDNGTEDFYQQ